MGQYDPSGCYDEVFAEVSNRIGERGEAGKADISILITGKRARQGRWITDFLLAPDARSPRLDNVVTLEPPLRGQTFGEL